MKNRTMVHPKNEIEILHGIQINGLDLNFSKYEPRFKDFRQAQWNIARSLPLAVGKISQKPENLVPRVFVIQDESLKSKKLDGIFIEKVRKDFSGIVSFDSLIYSYWLDPIYSSRGVILCDLQTAEKLYPEQVASVYSNLKSPTRISALANAAAKNGIFLFIPSGISIEKPILIDKAANGFGFTIENNLVSLGKNSQVILVRQNQSYSSKSENLYLENFSIYQDDASNLQIFDLQNLGKKVIYLGNQFLKLARDSRAEFASGQIGADEAHVNIGVELSGEGSNANIHGFYAPNKSQRFDIQTRQDHLAAHTQSNMHFKGVLSGQSHALWSGMINVSRNAQKSESYQTDNNLILDETAHIDSVPGMEILANDVKCKHGATIGKIDPNQLFYLESRGINRDEGEKLLVEAFLDPVIEKYPLPEIRYKIKKEIQRKLKR